MKTDAKGLSTIQAVFPIIQKQDDSAISFLGMISVKGMAGVKTIFWW